MNNQKKINLEKKERDREKLPHCRCDPRLGSQQAAPWSLLPSLVCPACAPACTALCLSDGGCEHSASLYGTLPKGVFSCANFTSLQHPAVTLAFVRLFAFSFPYPAGDLDLVLYQPRTGSQHKLFWLCEGCWWCVCGYVQGHLQAVQIHVKK